MSEWNRSNDERSLDSVIIDSLRWFFFQDFSSFIQFFVLVMWQTVCTPARGQSHECVHETSAAQRVQLPVQALRGGGGGRWMRRRRASSDELWAEQSLTMVAVNLLQNGLPDILKGSDWLLQCRRHEWHLQDGRESVTLTLTVITELLLFSHTNRKSLFFELRLMWLFSGYKDSL